jgi:hypothetical protein
MNWLLTEYLLKGIFLGLLAFAALAAAGLLVIAWVRPNAAI